MSLSRRHLLSAAAAGLIPAHHSMAQEGKELRILVPTGAGGPVDGIARVIGEQLGPALKQNVIVDNRGGAAGQLAATPVAKASGDPNMMLLGSLGIIAMSPHLYGSSLPYDVRRDFTPVILCARTPLALIVNPNVVPVRTVQEFTQWAKKQKNPIPYGSYGSGSVSHIAAVMFSSAASVEMIQVPYRDQPRIFSDLVKGDLPLIFEPPTAYEGYAKEKKLRILAVTSKSRSPAFPDLPTMDESGFPGFDFTNWFGLFMPGKVAPAAVERVRLATKAVVESAKFRDHFLPMGFDPTGAGAEDFPALVEKEIQRWQAFVRKNNIRLAT